MDRRGWVVTAVATAGMATSMVLVFAVSALAPFLVDDLGMSRATVGGLVAATFVVAAVGSLVGGHVVDVIGAWRGLLVLVTVVAVALVSASVARSVGWLVVALTIAGVGLALANPVTNLLLRAGVPPRGRGMAVGLKQAGGPLAALVVGLVLPSLAGAVGWRAALQWSVLLPAVLLVLVCRRAVHSGRTASGAGARWRWMRPSRWLVWLMGYSALLGAGLAAVNTYLPLYARQQLGLDGRVAGAALAVCGVSGLVARVWWARLADRLPDATAALSWLSMAASGFTALASLATPGRPGLLWITAFGVGGSATAANAVSMLAVIRGKHSTGHAAGFVSLGFFGGYGIGPIGFGIIAARAGYAHAWQVAALVLTASALLAIRRPSSVTEPSAA